jgi:16S rRNA processing protein RimM
MKQFLEIGKIVGTHGVRGEMRVEPWADSPDFVCGFDRLYFDKGAKEVEVLLARVHKRIVLMKLGGVDTMEAAAALRGKVLYMNRDDVELEDDAYFIQDLIGLTVEDADNGQTYGRLTEVSFTGANDVYHIQSENGKDYLIPAIPDVIIETDVEGGKMTIRPLKGIFDDED